MEAVQGEEEVSDARVWPGQFFPVWGADHYFRPEQRARALLRAIFRHLDEVCRELPAVTAPQAGD